MTYPTCPSCGGWGYLGARNDAVSGPWLTMPPQSVTQKLIQEGRLTEEQLANDIAMIRELVDLRRRLLDQAVRDVTDHYDRNCFMAADQDHDRMKCQECVELVARIRQRYTRLMNYENRDQ